jgi:hypothetical protein
MFDAKFHTKKPLFNSFFIGHDEGVNIVEKYDK